MEPKEIVLVTPAPYYKISFSCSNRAFYQVKNDVYNLAEKLGLEEISDLLTEKCDYEGDLETIIIYDIEFAKEVLKFYEIKTDIGDLDLHLSVY